jgi:tetratricopeptide (TPR) repeat protein
MPTEPSVDTAVAIDLLAQAYFAQSRYKEATELLRHALQLQGEWELGDSVRLRLSLDLAGVCAESGQINEANKLYERVAKDSAGSDLEITVLALSGQARAICRSNPEEGLKAARRAVTYAERLGSPFALATAQGVLANTLIIAGHALEPETTEVLTRAISGSEQTYGPEHPALAQLLQMYALLLHANGKQSEAQAIYRRGQTILDKVFGPDSLTAVQYRTEYEQMMALAIGPK